MARLKVWGGLTMAPGYSIARQLRTVVATTNQKEAAALVGCTVHEFRGYWCETANPAEVEAALSKPGTVFRATNVHGHNYRPLGEVK